MSSTWLPIEYRDFYDVPRAFFVERGGQLYFFDCPFDDAADAYPDEFRVYRLPTERKRHFDTTAWSEFAKVGQLVGIVPVTSVSFDDTKRASIRADVLDKIKPP